MPIVQPSEEALIEKLKNEGTFSFIDNDRPLDSNEEEAVEKAFKYSKHKFPPIKPIPGTIAFTFRNLKGGNERIFLALKELGGESHRRFVKEFIILWKNMDEFSKRRVDIWDILCEKYNIKRRRFWSAIQESLFEDNEALAQTALDGYKADLIELIKRMARMPKNHKDRALLAEIVGAVKPIQPMNIIDNSNHRTINAQINNNAPSFASSIKRSEKIIKDSTKKPLELSEGNQDYIDTEFSEVQEERMERVG